MKSERLALAAAIFGLLLALATSGCGVADEKRTRIVLITLDTLRGDGPGSSGSDLGPMPELTARAARGHRFTRFYAATSVTQPSHATMFTGLHPWQHGVSRNGQVLPEHRLTVAELLAEHGFETAAVVSSFPVAGQFGFARGFGNYAEKFVYGIERRTRWEEVWKVPEGLFFSPANFTTELAIAALDRATREQQFFWFHYFDPHAPYGDSRGLGLMHRVAMDRAAQGEDERKTVLEQVRMLYRADLTFLDEHLARLFRRLDQDHDDYTTHVIIVSDHGESLGEDGSLGHGTRLTDAQIRVPAVILSPRLRPATRSDVAGSIDIARTILSLAGVDAPLEFGGRDLTNMPFASEGAVGMRRTFAARRPTDTRVDGSVHELEPFEFYVTDTEGRVTRGNRSKLEWDPTYPDQQRVREEERLVELFQQLETQLVENSASPNLSAEDRRALKALGYAE